MTISMNNKPIGVFDSGVGGLTVVKALKKIMPSESFIYLGDTARVPYGTKSSDTIIKYSRKNASFLASKNIKLLVIACNTATSFALDDLKRFINIPVMGVIEPGAKFAIKNTNTNKIGIIGTTGTISSKAYEQKIASYSTNNILTVGQACPLFVPLAEEGWISGEVPELTAEHYLSSLKSKLPDPDVLVLGCTHYPLLQDTIQIVANKVFHHTVKLVDSATSTAYEVKNILQKFGLQNKNPGMGSLDVYVTDTSQIKEIGERFLGEPLTSIRQVDL